MTELLLHERKSYLHVECQNKIVATENARSINPGLKEREKGERTKERLNAEEGQQRILLLFLAG